MDLADSQIETSHSQKHICQHCSSMFVYKSDMDAHILLNHRVDQVYVCEICKVHHNTLLEARNHMDTHITLKSYNCKLCLGYFRSQTIANSHILNEHGKEGDVNLVEEISTKVSENHQENDIVIDLKANSRRLTQDNAEETQSNIHKDSVTAVDYVEKAKHSFSTVVNGKNKNCVLYIKGEETHNSGTVLYKKKEMINEEDSPYNLGVALLQNDGSVEMDTAGKTNTDIADEDILHFERNVSDNNDFNILESDKENSEAHNVKIDMNINLELCTANQEFQDFDEADKHPEFHDVSDNQKIYSEIAENFQNDATKCQFLGQTNNVMCQPIKPNHIIVKNPAEVRNSKLTCEICHKTLSSKSAFIAHLKIHDGVKPYTCLTCGRSFRKGSHLKDHIETHRGDARKRDFECSICQKKFFDRRVMRSHMKTHLNLGTNFRQFKCETCQKSFKRKSHLQEHTAVHLKHRPDVRTCSICKTGFKSVSSYNSHMLKHETGISRWAAAKTFKCGLCFSSYRLQSQLIAHEKRVHDKDKPFSCEICYRTFTRIDSLRDHQVLHDKDRKKFSCNRCSRTYLTFRSLEDHMTCHETGRSFCCASCDRTFLNNKSLCQHIKRYHSSQIKGKEQKNKSIIEDAKKTQIQQQKTEHQSPMVGCKEENVVNGKLASVIKDGAKVELHVKRSKVLKAQPYAKKYKNDTREDDLEIHESEKQDVEFRNENDKNGSVVESFEQKLTAQSNKTLVNDVSKEIYEESSCLSGIEELSNSSFTKTVNDNVIHLHSGNENDKGINTNLTGPEHLSFPVNSRKVYSGKRKKHEMSKVCPICGATFSTPQAQARHVDYIHGERKRFICEICGISLSSQTYLKKHLLRGHPQPKKIGRSQTVHVVKLENQ